MFILFYNPWKWEFCKNTFLTDKVQPILSIVILILEPLNKSLAEIYFWVSSLKFGNTGKVLWLICHGKWYQEANKILDRARKFKRLI